jgi:hypothetical protein
MTDFNNMTIMAALEVIASVYSHSDLEALEVEWKIQGRCRTDSKKARIVDLANIAIDENPEVLTPKGRMALERAIIEKALTAPPESRKGDHWKKLLAGLSFDGFSVHEGEQEETAGSFWKKSEMITQLRLKRMLPNDIPGLDFREAESEVVKLLTKYKMETAQGHLKQAISAFSRGEWASANAQLRTFSEGCLDFFAHELGCNNSLDSKKKRDFLGTSAPPFLSADLNEWNENQSKPQFVQGLISRLHPHGSHPGLSEEDDSTFRLQAVLITMRLFLRRFDKHRNFSS